MTFNVNRRPSVRSLAVLAAAAMVAFAAPAWPADAGGGPADPVLVQRGTVAVRKSDFDAEMLRIKEVDREEFLMSAKRIRELIERMMMTLEMADAAKAKGLDKDPAIARRMELEQDKVLGQAYLASVEAAAGREFDAKMPSVEAAARERYLVDKAKYTKPERVTISQLGIRGDTDPAAAKARADEAYAKLKAGADFASLIDEYVESPASAKLRITRTFTRAELDPALVPLAFDTAKIGEVNPPVRTSKGWNIVRVDYRSPAFTPSFDQVKGGIIDRMRDEYVTQARDAAMAALGGGQKSIVNEAAIDALRVPIPSAKN
jgi:parvulin-like peptidyl-prolyl isomerase